jgi:hypothetical protein
VPKKNLDYLRKIVNYGQHDAIKHWLKISQIRPHSATNEAAFYQLLDRHVGEGNLQLDQLRRLTLELDEYGQKRIYLGKLTNYKTIKLRERFEKHVKSLGYKLDAMPERKRELPSKPSLEYIVWTAKEVQIGYCETHQWMKPDRATLSWKPFKKTNYITISANSDTGEIKIMMDAPGEDHPHLTTFKGDSVLGYFPFYRSKAIELLGAEDYKEIDLLKVSRALTHETAIFKRKKSYDLTAHNSRVTTTSSSDVADDPAYAAGAKVDGEDRVFLGLVGDWLPEGSDKRLHRKISMHLSYPEKMLFFPGINLASEVEYALSRIRSV